MKIYELYKAMIENYPEPIMLIEVDSATIVSANQAAFNFYGYIKEELLGMPISDINTYSNELILKEMLEATENMNNTFTFNHQLKNGTIKSVNVVSYPITFEEKTYLFSTVTENENQDAELDVDILSAFQKSDDAICIIDSKSRDKYNVVLSNVMFNNLLEIELKDVNKLSLDMFFESDQLVNGRIVQTDFDGTLTTLNKKTAIQVNVQMMKLKYDGNLFYVLSFKAIDYFSLTSDLDFNNFEKALADNNLHKEGHLAKISLYMNTNDDNMFEKLSNKCETTIKKLINRLNMTCYLVNDSKNIYLFSNDDKAKVQDLLNILIKKIENGFENYYGKYHSRCRIAISSFKVFSLEQVKELEDIMSSFDLHEYNTIRLESEKIMDTKNSELKYGIIEAINADQMVLYAQPIINILENCVEGYEMLVRWNHPDYGIIPPDDFIPYAEFSGDIYEIDLWVLENTFDYIRSHEEETEEFIFHINLSTKTLSNVTFVNQIIQKSRQINLKNIVLEITEDPTTKMMDDVIAKLRALGFLFAIDDFGKGYSSFERIRNIGIEYLKIDKTFIEGLTENVDDVLILKAIIGMCSNLNIKVIAEGIEEVGQLEFLYSRKCTRIQGYLFSKPHPLEDLLSKLDDLKESSSQIIDDLASEVVVSKKFYNNGRIIQQDVDEYFYLITPNVALAEALSYEFEVFSSMNMLNLIPTQYKKTFTKFLEDLTPEIGFKTLMIKLLTHSGKLSKVICVAQKKANEHNYRLYIEFLDNLEENEIELLGLSHSYLQSFDEAPSGMLILSDVFTVKRWNKSCESIFGYTHQDIIGHNIVKKITFNNQIKQINILLNKSLKEGSAEMVIENTDAHNKIITTRWHVNTIFDELDASHQYICIVNDITESIKKSHELMKINKALDQSESIIMMTDTEGILEYVNKKFNDVTGYKHHEVIGKKTSILSSGEQSISFYQRLWTTIKSGNVWEGELHDKKKDNSLYWGKTTIYPIKDNGEITGFVSIQMDTTSEKKLMNQNANLKTRLFEQDKIASVGLLSSGIMHEINNPLSYIQGNIKYLIEQFGDYTNLDQEELEDLKDAISDVDCGITQIKNIAEGLKKYIFQGDVDEKVMVNLIDEINTVLILSKNEYKYHADVVFEYDTAMTYNVGGYASKLKQVFMNLVINASHAIASMNKDGLGLINIKLVSTPDQIWIVVEDDGCGMSAETINKIYEPFFTTKAVGIGSGLGLSVTRQIIEDDHDGVVLCESEVNKGTTFTIKLFKHI